MICQSLTMRFDSRCCNSKTEKEVVLLVSFLRGFGFGKVELLYPCEEEWVQGGCVYVGWQVLPVNT